MKWIQEFINLLHIKDKSSYRKDFNTHINLLVLKRSRLISMAVLILAPFFLIFDILLAHSHADRSYLIHLIGIHVSSLLVSVIYLCLYKKIIKIDSLILYIPRSFVLFYVFLGTVSSLNSQRLSGNIYAYIIHTFIASALLIQKPVYMLIIYITNHILFVGGMLLISNNYYELLTINMNALILLSISFLFSIYNYGLQLKDYANHIQLKESQENFRRLFEINPFSVLITRFEDGKIIEMSEKAKKLLEVKPEETECMNITSFYANEDSRSHFTQELLQKGRIQSHVDEYRIHGRIVWAYTNHEIIEYKGKRCILSGIVDITDIRRVEEELSKYASIDMMTGLLNRRMGIQTIGALMDSTKDTCTDFTLCFADLNDLKYVNDTFGHNEGDNYIKSFCKIVNSKLSKKDYFFRMGGDEFIILFVGNTVEEAEAIWKQILEGFARKNQSNANYQIVVSHGLSYFSKGMNLTLEHLIEQADGKMYQEKSKYKQLVNKNK